MPQLLFYVECTQYNKQGVLVDVHNSMSGGLPILYKNESKAVMRCVNIASMLEKIGYQCAADSPLPPFDLTNPCSGYRQHIAIREVYVQT